MNEEQLKEILNQEEIARIENQELREIRMKYWILRHQAFKDEHNVSDNDLVKILDDLNAQEKIELTAFRNKKEHI